MTTERYILVIGCFDTKSEDFSFLCQCISTHGENIITINTGVMETDAAFRIDYASAEVAEAGGYSIDQLREKRDRGLAISAMGTGAAVVVKNLVAAGQVKGAIGMGGGGGTFIALTAMQEIPLGIPKICLSTLAGKDVSRRVGNKDITLMPSIVDVAGLNRISRLLIKQAAAAVSAMCRISIDDEAAAKGRIAISMFGNTTACVTTCAAILKARGFETFVFHANGIGGATMEHLITNHYFDAVLDITTTELADELCGGICSAGASRLEAASAVGIPQVIVPGCMDMVNFAQPDTVPRDYAGRQLYSWSPDVTLMRTNEKENRQLGHTLVSKAAMSAAPVTILLPLKGISQIDASGGPFYRPDINRVLFDTIKEKANGEIKVVEVDVHINDEAFAHKIIEALLEIIT